MKRLHEFLSTCDNEALLKEYNRCFKENPDITYIKNKIESFRNIHPSNYEGIVYTFDNYLLGNGVYYHSEIVSKDRISHVKSVEKYSNWEVDKTPPKNMSNALTEYNKVDSLIESKPLHCYTKEMIMGSYVPDYVSRSDFKNTYAAIVINTIEQTDFCKEANKPNHVTDVSNSIFDSIFEGIPEKVFSRVEDEIEKCVYDMIRFYNKKKQYATLLKIYRSLL